jgi:glycosyltransferase involved in cell wall biosynthesis
MSLRPGIDPSAAPLVTIVIPTHDRPEFAARAVASALAQIVSELEVVVVDDGSAPPFRYAEDDARVRVIRRDTAGGVSAARNLGLGVARGEWVVFLDDDDELLPDMLDVSLEAAASSSLPPPVAVLSGIQVVTEDGRMLETFWAPTISLGKRYFLDGSPGERFQSEPTLLAPTDVVRSIEGFDERLRASVHKDFFLRLNDVCSLQGLQRETYRKTVVRGPRLTTNALAHADALVLTIAKHQDVIARYPRKHAQLLGSAAMNYLIAGRWGSAISSATRAVARMPFRPKHYVQLLACVAGPRPFALARRFKKRLHRA